MKSRLFSLLDPLGPLSPLNPRHRLNPFRSQTVARRPPGELEPSSHASVLAQLYGDRGSLDTVPVPNMEWWWQTIDVVCDDGSKYSIITNVQIFGVPVSGWVAQATVCVRDVATGEMWEAHTTGAFDPGTQARFIASGWSLGFAPLPGNGAQDQTYRVHVANDDLTLQLQVELGAHTLLGDPGAARGWYDLNPDGLVPLWASYRSRFAEPESGPHPRATMILRGRGTRTIDKIVRSRLDQQSLHLSPRDYHDWSLPSLAEAVLIRPQWLWYHAELQLQGEKNANLMLCKVVNGHTNRTMKLAAAICPAVGAPLLVPSDKIRFEDKQPQQQLNGRIKAPRVVLARFETALVKRSPWCGRYELTLQPKPSPSSAGSSGTADWTVRYPIVGPFGYNAQEVPIRVKGHVKDRDGDEHELVGEGTQEVLDLLKSVTLSS